MSVIRYFKPCPFCKTTPNQVDLSEVYGTDFEFDCSGCELVSWSAQISDYMTIEERRSEETSKFWKENTQYLPKYVDRVIEDFCNKWDTREEGDL